MTFRSFFCSALLLSIVFFSCKNEAAEPVAIDNLIPKPVSLTKGTEKFTLQNTSSIYVLGDSSAVNVGEYLAQKLRAATGFDLKVNKDSSGAQPSSFFLLLTKDETLGKEGYELETSKDKLVVKANSAAGLFYGVQTIRQLLPASIEGSSKKDGPWEITTGTIKDFPEYSYRGSMLDVARHFFDVDDVKRYIDLISYYKMNVLHLHLSDDQGWRIEIKSWPNLTTHGGSTEVGGGKGGFYTQEQYKDIVKYARDRFVTIVPEIDMPGHTNAALSSYAELNCNDTATKLYTGIEVGFSTLCTKKEITYKFVDDVVRELAEMTPGPYIHIGGDESHATKKEDYIPFVNRVQEIVKKHNKLVLGWDEIALSTLIPNSTAQYWADADNSKAAVRQGAKILMSPAKKAYLDMQYDSTSKFGLHWAAYIEVDSAYIWEPAKLVDSINRENIIGVEAALWSETISKMDEIEWLMFPRLPGYAEIGWSPAKSRSWDEYKIRLGNHAGRFKALNIDYYPSRKVNWSE